VLEEHWITPHRRALIVDAGGKRVYSIDVYVKLAGEPRGCKAGPRAGRARLCYVTSGECEAVVSVTPGYVELISLRLEAEAGRDPAGGDPVEALKLCASRIADSLGVSVEEILRSPEWREG